MNDIIGFKLGLLTNLLGVTNDIAGFNSSDFAEISSSFNICLAKVKLGLITRKYSI